jgi:hypothetical protein
MNRLTFKSLEHHYGIKVTELPTAGRGRPRLQIDLPTLGRAFGLDAPPAWTDDDGFTAETQGLDSAEREFVQKVVTDQLAGRSVKAIAKFAKAKAAILDNKRLSDAGRREQIAQAAQTMVAELSKHRAALAPHKADVDRTGTDLFAVPRPTDPATLADDREIRDVMLRGDGLKSTLSDIIAGRAGRIVEALKRSPLPIPPPFDEHVNDAWRNAVAAREPQKVAAWKSASDQVAWAQHVIETVAPLAVQIAELSPAEAHKVVAAA